VLRGTGAADSIIAVSAGATPFACALSASGTAQCWGVNDYGEIGDGAAGNVRSPTRVRISEPLASISAGENAACGLTRDGRALCWGLNDNGQLGVGDSAVHQLPVPVRTRFRFRQISVGAAGGTCGVLIDARLLCWGRNDGGQLGTADETSVLTPRVPTMLAAERFSVVTVGNSMACGLTTDARVLCWGSPGKYLGSNAPDMVSVVQLAVPKEEHVVSVANGFYTSCLLTQSHRIYCWGSNEYRVLGRRGAASTEVALGPITSDADYAALSVGAFGCAVTVDGALDCWGAHSGRRLPFAADTSRVERIPFE
jgi:alpha-tubulin suppressor-like RCC1 family protein